MVVEIKPGGAQAARANSGALPGEIPEKARHDLQRVPRDAARQNARPALRASRVRVRYTHKVGRPSACANTSFGNEPPRLGNNAGDFDEIEHAFDIGVAFDLAPALMQHQRQTNNLCHCPARIQ